MKIALLGGSFDPPHLGHRELVKSILTNFDEVWILPSFTHPFQKQMSDFSFRIQLCELNFSDLSPNIKIKLDEKDLASQGGYSINLIHHLKKKYDNVDFYWVMGSDTLAQTDKWKDFDEIKKLVHLHPIARAGYENSTLPEISSTQIRDWLKSPQLYMDLLKQNLHSLVLGKLLTNSN